jgi:predicted membrane-bound spermidine synthase
MASLFIHAVFVISGLAALVYQVVWQRALMTIYGSNIESVAMVVSAFLVGLGIGSIAGGEISKRKVPLVLVFSAAELLIGAYGVFSLDLFHWVSTYTLRAGTLETGLLAFALVFVPTLLMGSTLPLLVAYRVKSTGHVGKSVSWLYFVNTLGGGLGAFLATFTFLRLHGLSGSVQVAALLNVVSAAIVLAVYALRKRD